MHITARVSGHDSTQTSSIRKQVAVSMQFIWAIVYVCIWQTFAFVLPAEIPSPKLKTKTGGITDFTHRTEGLIITVRFIIHAERRLQKHGNQNWGSSSKLPRSVESSLYELAILGPWGRPLKTWICFRAEDTDQEVWKGDQRSKWHLGFGYRRAGQGY